MSDATAGAVGSARPPPRGSASFRSSPDGQTAERDGGHTLRSMDPIGPGTLAPDPLHPGLHRPRGIGLRSQATAQVKRWQYLALAVLVGFALLAFVAIRL